MTESYYDKHVFFCINHRDSGKRCCADYDAVACRDHAKARMKALGLHGKGQTRINQAGCLDRCDEGPVLVVYPDNVWYSYVDKEDIDEIIDQHLVKGEVVERLKI